MNIIKNELTHRNREQTSGYSGEMERAILG